MTRHLVTTPDGAPLAWVTIPDSLPDTEPIDRYGITWGRERPGGYRTGIQVRPLRAGRSELLAAEVTYWMTQRRRGLEPRLPSLWFSRWVRL